MINSTLDQQPEILLCGTFDHDEFLTPLHSLNAEKNNVLQINKLLAQIQSHQDQLRLIFLLQAYPDQFSSTFIRSIRQSFPCVPVFIILGAWCEGELRTGRPIQGANRIYAAQWNDADTALLNSLIGQQPVPWVHPHTVGDDEFALGKSKRSLPPTVKKQFCLIPHQFGPFGNDSAMNRLLADRERQNGVDRVVSASLSHSLTEGIPFDRIILDCDDSPMETILDSFQKIKTRWNQAEIIVYYHSPRIDERRILLNAGVDQIIAKPLGL